MKVEKIKELENFANDFNHRLQLSELELEDEALYKKLNIKKIKNGRNKSQEVNSFFSTPIKSKSQFRLVIKKKYIIIII